MRRGVALAGLAAAVLVLAAGAAANVALTQLSSDPFTNTTSRHKTEVEPDTFSAGSTIVAVMQVGRFFDGGSSDIGFATSTNGGASWTSGFLPGLTTFSSPAGPYDRVSDPSVAYDAAHGVWLVSSLALDDSSGVDGVAVVASRSTDGGLTWSNPVTVAAATGSSDFDKNWTACDDTPASPFYGSCYTEYDDFGHSNQVHVAYSQNGGLTWQEGSMPRQSVIGGQPVVQPGGVVIMPIDNGNESQVLALHSTDGGVTWSKSVKFTSIKSHRDAGSLRSGPLPSAEIDGAGRVYVVWADCRFRAGCKANDIVISTSSDGKTWTQVARIPIDAVNSGVDHFLPGLAVDPSTSGSTAKLALAYYYYPSTGCTSSTCQLDVGFVSSSDGGATWSTPTQLAGPMTLKWLPSTSQGRMVGDYISTSISATKAYGAFAVANAPTAGGSDCASATPNCDQATYAPASGLAPLTVRGPLSSAGESPVPGAHSDHPVPSQPLSAR